MIRKCIPIPQKICNITKRLRTPDEVEKYFPEFLSFIDVTIEQQQIPRPTDNRRKKIFCPRKKKRHVVKAQLMVNNPGIIIHKTANKKGCRHDYDIYKKNYPVTPNKVVIMCLTLDI